MMQYEFRIVSKRNDSWHLICATAKSADIARNQIANAYQGFTVSVEPINEYPAHYYCNELDCSMCEIDDVQVAA